MKQAISNYLKSRFPDGDFRVLDRRSKTSEGVYVTNHLGLLTQPMIIDLVSYASRHHLHFYVSAEDDRPEFHLYK